MHDTLGHDLPIFGSSLFANGGGSFAPASGAVPPADYTIGAGDQLVIRTWGKVDIDVHPTVDRNGQIFVPRVGMLTVAGLRLDKLTDFIHNAISQQFTGFELSVSLGQFRSIQIFVLGNAHAPRRLYHQLAQHADQRGLQFGWPIFYRHHARHPA